MFIVKDLSGQNTAVSQPFLADGEGTDITKGALVEAPDISGPTGLGAVERIGSAAAPADVVGVALEDLDVSVDGQWTYDGTLTTATNRPEINVDTRPGAIIRVELAESNDLTVYNDSDTAGVDITFANATPGADDLFGGGWLYDDGTEQLRFIEDHDAQASAVLNTATTTALADASNITAVIVPSRLYGAGANCGLTLSTNQDQIYIDGDETTLWAIVYDIHVQASNKVGLERLNPGLHDAITTSSAKLYADIVIKDHAFNVGD